MPDITNLRHDEFFKKALEDKKVLKDFLTFNLPDEVKSIVDLENVQMQKESFIEDDLKNSLSDVLLKTKFNDKEGYIYLLVEHQSTSDKYMAYRLFRYVLNICDRYKTQNKTFPLIYPMLFYTGSKKYSASRNIWELFENPDLAKKFLSQDYRLIDLSQIDDNQLFSERLYGLMAFIMKSILSRSVAEIFKVLQEHDILSLSLKESEDFIYLILAYTVSRVETKQEFTEIKQIIQNNLGDQIMGQYIQEIINQGKQEGIQIGQAKGKLEGKLEGKQEGIQIGQAKGKLEVAQKLLQKGFDIEEIVEVTNISADELRKLSSK